MQPEQWKYVDSDKTSGWLRGPLFLWEPHDEWQDFDDDPPTLHAENEEVKKTTVLSTVTIEPSYVLEVVKGRSKVVLPPP